MLKYAYGLADIPDLDFTSAPDQLFYLNDLKDQHVRQIHQNLKFTATAIAQYSEINHLDLNRLISEKEVFAHANSIWNVIMIAAGSTPSGYAKILTSYGSKNYLYCIAIWNCAYQVLLNEKDVYNITIAEFFEAFDNLIKGDTNYGDRRTAPLFKLISQIGDFRINYEE